MTDSVKYKLSTLIGVFLQMTIEEQNESIDVCDILDIKGPLKIPHLIKLARELEEDIPNIWNILAHYVIKTLHDGEDKYAFIYNNMGYVGSLDKISNDGILHFINVVSYEGYEVGEIHFNLPEALRNFHGTQFNNLIEANETASWDY